ncbi:MAG: hypothetical protein ABIO92_05260 [Chloroflexia bacterium]
MRLLFLTPRFPYPPLKGDSLRVYHQLRTLSREHQIVLVSMAEGPVSEAEYAQVACLCERIVVVPLPRWRAALNLIKGIMSSQPMQVSYYRSTAVQQQIDTLFASERFDVVHTTLIRMLPYVWDIHNPPVVVDLIDSLRTPNKTCRACPTGFVRRSKPQSGGAAGSGTRPDAPGLRAGISSSA